MKLPINKQGLTPITIEEFRESGMLMLTNMFLQPFGMAIAVRLEEGKPDELFTARTAFRGFLEADQEEMHERIAKYLADNAIDFPEDIKD